VLKDFMHSTMWQDQLEACQKQVQHAGAPTPCVKNALRHLAFVQPRFAGFVTPRRRYVCLLRAIAMVLAVKAGDERLDSAVQRRANAAELMQHSKHWANPRIALSRGSPGTTARHAWSFCGTSTSTITTLPAPPPRWTPSYSL
jgi:hypothetical protein